MAGKSPNEVDGFNGKIKVTIVGGIRSTGWWKNGDHCRLLPWKNDFSSRGLICFTRYVVIPLSQVLPVIFGEETCWITMIYPTFPPSHVDVSHFFVNLLMTFTSHFTIYCHICIMHYHWIIIDYQISPYISPYIAILCGPFFCCNPSHHQWLAWQPRRARPKPSKPQPEPSLGNVRFVGTEWPGPNNHGKSLINGGF